MKISYLSLAGAALLAVTACTANPKSYLDSGSLQFTAHSPSSWSRATLGPVIGFAGNDSLSELRPFLLSGSAQLPELAVSTKLPFAKNVTPSQPQYATSGTFSFSKSITTQEKGLELLLVPRGRMTPLLAFTPSIMAFTPGENESWLEVDRTTKTVSLFRGSVKVKEMKGEGEIALQPDVYSLQHKQRRPLWYATDSYFEKRKLTIPAVNDRLRYRKGALGSFVLYPTTAFPIHAAPVWSDDVGGLRVSRADLSSVYYMIPVGTTVVVR